MKTPEILIAHPQTNEQLLALKAFLQALKIKFEVSHESGYNAAFVEKILESKKQIAQCKFEEVKHEDLKAYIEGI